MKTKLFIYFIIGFIIALFIQWLYGIDFIRGKEFSDAIIYSVITAVSFVTTGIWIEVFFTSINENEDEDEDEEEW